MTEPNKSDRDHAAFLHDTLRGLTLEEKVGQMAQVDIAQVILEDHSGLDPQKVQHYFGDLKVGSILNTPTKVLWTAQQYRKAILMIQEVVSKNKNPIPVIWGLDSVHGANYVNGARVTPQAINLAASFDTELSFQAGKWASTDTRRAGIPWLFSPLVGLAWQPLWSRVYETFGEDPLLVGSMAKAMIRGIQAPNDETTFAPSLAAACAKHWVGYSKPHNGHDRAPSFIPRRQLMQYFIPPWKQALQGDDQALTVMESYTETDGVPNVANRENLLTLLRQRLNYTEGMLVTDYAEIYNLASWHGISQSRGEAVKRSFTDTTVDMSMVPLDVDEYIAELTELVKSSGQAAVHKLDEHARRVLLLKKKLGMFDETVSLLTEDYTKPTDKELEEARNMTRKTIILATNERPDKVDRYYQRRRNLKHGKKERTLPLNSAPQGDGRLAAKTMNVLITGPTSDSFPFQSGGWTGRWQGVPPEEEVSKWFKYGQTVRQAAESEATWNVIHRCGVNIQGGECSDHKHHRHLQEEGTQENNSNVPDEPATCETHDDHDKSIVGRFKDFVGWHDSSDSNDSQVSYHSIKSAMNDACDQDLIIVCVGEENYAEKPGDIRSLKLPNGQYDLVRGLRAQASEDTKLVVVYFGGRPRLLGDMVDLADAVILGFLPGPEAGPAIIDLLKGRYSPSAKLPITYPKYEDSGGSPYLHSVSDQCTKDTKGPLPHWENIPCEVQFPFGHGLSYAEFEYSDLEFSADKISFSPLKGDDPVFTILVKVSNTGNSAGEDTVMMFTFDLFRDTTPEYKRLRAFKKVWLEPGESKTVQLAVKLSELRFIGPHDDAHYVLQNGQQFRVGIGASSNCRTEVGLCTPAIPIIIEDEYTGACEAACTAWEDSSCMPFFKMSNKSCWDSCMAIRNEVSSNAEVQMNNDGWGWNYVDCIESVVFGNRDAFRNDSSQCWKMTSFCRDITSTGRMDEFAHGPMPYRLPGGSGGGVGSANVAPASVGRNPASTVLAGIFGALGTVLLFLAARSWTQRRKVDNSNYSDGEIQFSTISQDEELTL